MVTDFDTLYGNATVKQILSNHIQKDTLSHAYILNGPKGSGKHSFAREIAAAVSCEKRGNHETIPCRQCNNCYKILKNISPDVRTISMPPDRKSIGVEDIRALQQDIFLMPNDLDKKIYIIKDAHLLTPEAQNAFLKLLEEPPVSVLFLLLCENTANLLPTIKSRAPMLTMQTFTEKELTAYLLAYKIDAQKFYKKDAEAFAFAIKAAKGSIGVALHSLSTKEAEEEKKVYDKVKKIVEAVSGRTKKSDFFIEMTSLTSKREEAIEILFALWTALRDLLLVKKEISTPKIFFRTEEEATELASYFTEEWLIQSTDGVEAARNALYENSSVSMTLWNCAIFLWKKKE